MRPQSDLDVREQWQAASQRERANFFEFIIEDAILATCKAGDTAIDVGANYGAHSYTMLNRVGERGLVFAFEPNPVVFEALSALRRRHQQFRPMCVALSNRQGTAELIVPKDLGYGSLTALSDGEMQRVFKVEIDCLDSIPEVGRSLHLSLIKAGVEGEEIRFLRGALKTISRGSPIVIIEIAWHNTFVLGGERVMCYEEACWNALLMPMEMVHEPMLKKRLRDVGARFFTPFRDWTPYQKLS